MAKNELKMRVEQTTIIEMAVGYFTKSLQWAPFKKLCDLILGINEKSFK